MMYRLTYEKLGTAAYISHLEMGKVIERSFRRADIAVDYSEGFNPHMKMSFGPALALGCQSYCEMLDISIQYFEPSMLGLLNSFVPCGVKFFSADLLPERYKSIIVQYSIAKYTAILPHFADLSLFSDFNSKTEVIYEKITPKGRKTIDAKKIMAETSILHQLSDDSGKMQLDFSLFLNRTGGTLKPSEFVASIFGNETAYITTYCRTGFAEESEVDCATCK